ncbi:hypothetical protein HMI54_010436 [Coelomomyces lativittatus]|nr:hypothetical protein HMI54_010436 [Coelomomyces lativittatus]
MFAGALEGMSVRGLGVAELRQLFREEDPEAVWRLVAESGGGGGAALDERIKAIEESGLFGPKPRESLMQMPQPHSVAGPSTSGSSSSSGSTSTPSVTRDGDDEEEEEEEDY